MTQWSLKKTLHTSLTGWPSPPPGSTLSPGRPAAGLQPRRGASPWELPTWLLGRSDLALTSKCPPSLSLLSCLSSHSVSLPSELAHLYQRLCQRGGRPSRWVYIISDVSITASAPRHAQRRLRHWWCSPGLKISSHGPWVGGAECYDIPSPLLPSRYQTQSEFSNLTTNVGCYKCPVVSVDQGWWEGNTKWCVMMWWWLARCDDTSLTSPLGWDWPQSVSALHSKHQHFKRNKYPSISHVV